MVLALQVGSLPGRVAATAGIKLLKRAQHTRQSRERERKRERRTEEKT
jgi:hypothetical protein